MHDSRGAEIKVGDRVLIEAEVTELNSGDENFCCCTVAITLPEQSGAEKVMNHRPTVSAMSTKMLTKIGTKIVTAILFALLLAAPASADELSVEAKMILAEIGKVRSEMKAEYSQLRGEVNQLRNEVQDLQAMRAAEQSRRDAEQAEEARKPVAPPKSEQTFTTVTDQWGRQVQVPTGSGTGSGQTMQMMMQGGYGGGMMQMRGRTIMRGGRGAGGCSAGGCSS